MTFNAAEEYAKRAGRERVGDTEWAELCGTIWSVSDASSDEWHAYRDRCQPTDEEWASARSRFASGMVVRGVVLSHHRFGFFVDLSDQVLGLVEIPRVKDPGQSVSPEDYPAVGEEITAVVLDAVDLQRQVHLSIRPSDLKAAMA